VGASSLVTATFTAENVAITISPTALTVLAGSTVQFSASVTGAVNDSSVTWSATTGSISASGLYTAPAAAGTDTVTVTSVADPSKSASATVNVLLVTSPTLVADYQFANVYTSSVGSPPALTDIGAGTNSFAADTVRGASQTVLVFPTGNGLQLSPTTGLFANDVYTISALVRLDTVSGYRRFFDFKNATSDTGLYNLSGSLYFYPITGSSTVIPAGGYVNVVLTRAADKTVTGYVNGVQELTFADTSNLAVIDGNNILRFFKDDNPVPNENSSGAVARIRIWNGALTAAQVFALEPPAFADLAVSVVSASGSTVNVTVTNSGPSAATNVVLTDTLDRYVLVSATPSQGSCSSLASVVTCSLGALAFGANASVTVVTKPPSGGWASQQFHASANQTDPNPVNNSAWIGPALDSFNTQVGSGVSVSVADATSGMSASLTFSSITRPGSTTMSALSGLPPAPAGFRSIGTPVVFDLSTSADFSGPVTVTLPFAASAFRHPAQVHLFHLENGAWVDRTTTVNVAASRVIGTTGSLSPFALFEPLNTTPVANAGTARILPATAASGTTVRLDASLSNDADGDALNYRWSGAFPEGSGVVSGVNPNVTLPMGTARLTLIVNDGEVDSAPALVDVTVSDFALAVNGNSTIARGQSASYAVAVTPVFGAFDGPVVLACGNLPAGMNCSFSPASVTPGQAGTNSTLTITTTVASSRPRGPLFAFWLAIMLGPIGLAWSGRNRRGALLLLLMVIVIAAVGVGCGGGGTAPVTANTTTTTLAQAVTVTVTGTSSGLQHSATATLLLK
jgi:uncharacterized repeat protein (TIGR01451 family)